MMDLQAAIGIHQLKRIEQTLARRNEIWRAYDEAFAGLPIDLPAAEDSQTVHARHLYTVMIDSARCGVTRDDFMQKMNALNIGTGVHYIGVHLHPYYRDRFGYTPESFPNATWISDRTVSIPLSPKLTDEEVEAVIDAVRSCVRR